MTAPDFGASHDSATAKRKSAHGAVVTLLAQALKFVIQFGSMIVLSRLLVPRDFGLIALVAPVLGFIRVFSDLGFGQAIVQRPIITQPQVSALFWVNIVISAGLTALALAAAPLLGRLYGDPRIVWVAIALSALIMIASLPLVPGAILNRQMRFLPLAICDVASLAAGAAAGIASASAGYGYWSLVIMQTASAVTALLITWCFAGWRPSWPAREAGMGSLLSFGANVTGSNLATYFAMSADNIIVGWVNGQTALGLYDRSYNLVVQPLMQIMAPISRVAVPLLSRLADTPERFERAYLQMLSFALLATSPELIFNVMRPELLVSFLLGDKWLAMTPIFAWICLGGLASTLNASAAWILIAQNRTAEQVKYFTINAAISVASFSIGAYWGVVEVAMASAISFSILQTPLLLAAATRAGAVKRDCMLRTIAPFIVAGCVTALALYVLRPGGPKVWALALSLIEAYGVFGLVMVAFPAGRAMVRDGLALRSAFLKPA